jgi:hypothetical protein
MTALTHSDSRIKPAARALAPRGTASPGRIARHVTLKRICLQILVGLLGCGALVAVIAIKTAAYFWRFPI